MNRFMQQTLAVGLTLSGIAHTHAAVWSVEKDGERVYVGGTIHVLGPSDYPLPPSYQAAYNAAEELLFETDITTLATPAFQTKVMSKYVFNDGQTFGDHVSPETLAAVKTHLGERGLPYETMQSLSPSLMALTLPMLELQLNGIEQAGVDMHFAEMAAADGKPINWFETIDQQVDMIGDMAAGHEDEYLTYTLSEIPHTMNHWDKLLVSWRSADLDSINTEMVMPLMEEAPYAYEVMLRKRNEAWMPKLEALFEDEDTEFVLVGMAHLAGEDGVLAKLEALGYSFTLVE